MDQLWKLQDQVFTTGEFNYEFDSDATCATRRRRGRETFRRRRREHRNGHARRDRPSGDFLARGVTLDPGSVKLDDGWYSGYLRVATNERGVVRSYFSAGKTRSGKRVEGDARNILEKEFRGKVID